MKVVFLDIDGVLNSTAWLQSDRRPGIRLPVARDHMDPLAVRRLDALVQATGAKVVLSSTWRRFTTLDEIRAALEHHGADVDLIDATPYFPNRERGDECMAWLRAHPAVTAFVCLDDDGDFDVCMGRLVQTRFATGLLDEHVDRAIALLTVAA